MFHNRDPFRLNIAGGVDLLSGRAPEVSWLGLASHSFDSRVTSETETHFFAGPDTIRCSRPCGLEIIADAELHNRLDLLETLSPAGDPSSCPDSLLILMAYEKWGEQCADFLLGEYSFAIWDGPLRRLYCCRDHFGARPFFYWFSGSRFAFASDPFRLFRIPGVPHELDRTKLGAFALMQDRDHDHPDETFFQGIFSLPSATTLTFDRARLTRRVYWTPEQSRVDVPARDEDAFAALRDLLFEAVACRIRGKSTVSALLSGGLDSSSLVAIAARHLEKSNRSLVALAGVLPESSKPQFRDEREFIDEFRSWPNVTIEYVASEHGGPFDGIEDPSRFAPSPIPLTRKYLLDALQNAALHKGADVILFGGAGEAGPTAPANEYYLELALSLRWVTLARELRRFQVVRRRNPARFFARLTRDSLYPDRSTDPPLFLLAPDYLRRLGEAKRIGIDWPNHRRAQVQHTCGMMNLHSWPFSLSASGVPQTCPYLDKRVIEFCLAAPGHMKVRDGYHRYLIRRSLDGILPPKIQWRTTKMPFSPDYPKRYRAQIGKARNFVAAIRQRDPVLQIVDVDRLRHILNRHDASKDNVFEAITVPLTIYLICFLRQFAEFQP